MLLNIPQCTGAQRIIWLKCQQREGGENPDLRSSESRPSHLQPPKANTKRDPPHPFQGPSQALVQVWFFVFWVFKILIYLFRLRQVLVAARRIFLAVCGLMVAACGLLVAACRI